LVFGSQATIYAIRQRRHLWGSRPSLWLAASSAADIAIASTLAVGGIAMTPLPVLSVVGTLVAAIAFAFVLDAVKVPVFARLQIAWSAVPSLPISAVHHEELPLHRLSRHQPK
jgi:H+-transporting ATPase